MTSVVFLATICAVVMGGVSFTSSNAYALSCEVDDHGNCVSFPEITSPLKQFKSGISIADIFCHNSYLVIKQSTGTPACVVSDTELIERGWAVTFDDYIKNGQNVEIVLENPHCFGTCPVYTVTISNDGTLVFEGIEYLETIGVVIDTISTTDIAHLISYINKINYFSLEDAEIPPITDVPFIYTSVTMGDKTHTIRNYVGEFGISEITKLESMINGLANSQNRIDGTSSKIDNLNETTISTFYVDSKLVDCVDVAPQQCMLIRENSDVEWEMFYGNIDGFKFQEGIEYKINVEIT